MSDWRFRVPFTTLIVRNAESKEDAVNRPVRWRGSLGYTGEWSPELVEDEVQS